MLDRVFPPGECDDDIGEHYQRTGHYIVGGYCFYCWLNEQPPESLHAVPVTALIADVR